uniref:Glycolipid transfer protein domain-containing protein n=1 Tax=Bionectria ochroleuca TaxID=29856 RepID=A0A0B7JTM9_BIOOC
MSSKPYPEGGTVLQTFKQAFTDVAVDENNKVDTTQFLEAAESWTTLFDAIAAVAFSPVKKDMLFNVGVVLFILIGTIEKIYSQGDLSREFQTAAPTKSTTLQDLIEHELSSNKQNAADGLLWLIRAIDFTFRALKRTVGNPKEELAESFRISYKETLKPYHPFWIKPVFTASMSLCPYRAAFIANLGDDAKQATSELKTHLEALSKTINILSPFIEAKAANKWK